MRSLLLLSALLLAAAAAGHSSPAVGGWTPIKNLADPEVQQIANFAVAENNKKANGALKLSGVLSGETQVVSGLKYRLIVKATGAGAGAAAGEYEAIVWDQPWKKFLELISFKKVKY